MSIEKGDKPRKEKKPRPRRQDREVTRSQMRTAALELLEERGPLAGLTLKEVAAAAGVNRVQIYQYYGTREALIRAAISELIDQGAPKRESIRKLPFKERRMAMFDHFLEQPVICQLEALMALDGDEEFQAFVEFEHAMRSLQNDVDQGHIPKDTDVVLAHIMTRTAYMGYCIFREAASRDAGIPLSELDERAREMFKKMLDGIANPNTSEVAAEAEGEADAGGVNEATAAE